MLNGGEPIPVSRPPCADDEDICPKVRPGHSDLNDQAMEIFLHWRMCRSLDEWPDDFQVKRYRRILDGIVSEHERYCDQSALQQLTRAIGRMTKR